MLPEAVRARVVVRAAAALGALPADALPAPLRRIAKFTPQRRARLGGTVIAAHLAGEPAFRQAVADSLAGGDELTTAVAAGTRPAAADPVEVAALAYLLRPDNWVELVTGAAEMVRTEADRDAAEQRIKEAEQRADKAEQARAAAAAELGRLRTELAEQRAALAAARNELHAVQKELRETARREKRASDLLRTEQGRATVAEREHEAELRRLRTRLADAEATAATARAGGKEARAFDDARVWLLLQTVREAARGLARELALEPTDRTPADFVADEAAERPGSARAGERALDATDPARLDQLLSLPRAHLVVDGYNVTKTGYGELSLEQQRNRLVRDLGALRARTNVEITCVWDGAEPVHGLPPPPRGVRVLFSRKGETADELIRRLVRAEPDGRPVVVISADREVADGVRRHGAYPLPSHALLRRLTRG